MWHIQPKSSRLPFNPCSAKQPVMHIWTGRGFLWLFNNRRKLSISVESTQSTKPQMAFFFMWRLWKTRLTSETFPFSPFFCRHPCHSKPPFPWAMTSSYWSHSYKTLLLHPIPLAYAIHMAGREQKTHCSRFMLLFEAASKGMREDLEYNVEATHLTSFPLRIE